MDPLRSVVMQSVSLFQNMKEDDKRKNSEYEFYLPLLIKTESEKEVMKCVKISAKFNLF